MGRYNEERYCKRGRGGGGGGGGRWAVGGGRWAVGAGPVL